MSSSHQIETGVAENPTDKLKAWWSEQSEEVSSSKTLSREIAELKEDIEELKEKLTCVGILDCPCNKEEEQGSTRLDKVAKTALAFVDPRIRYYFGLKTGLIIASILALINILFLVLYTWWQVNRCDPLVQVFDALMVDKLVENASIVDELSKSETRHLCSTEMISLRSQYYSLQDLQELQDENLTQDEVCHFNGGRTKHALVEMNSSSRRAHPSLEVHDVTWVEWYPCMFHGMSCKDYGPSNKCKEDGSDIILRACENGMVQDWSDKQIPPSKECYRDGSQKRHCPIPL